MKSMMDNIVKILAFTTKMTNTIQLQHHVQFQTPSNLHQHSVQTINNHNTVHNLNINHNHNLNINPNHNITIHNQLHNNITTQLQDTTPLQCTLIQIYSVDTQQLILMWTLDHIQ